jgi:hypothetical protein
MFKHVSFVHNALASQISETETHFKISGVPVVIDGAEMNDVIYDKEDNEKGLESLVGKVLTLGHPFDADGNPIDAYSAKAMQDNFAGGAVTKWYKKGDINLVDLEIKKALLQAQDGGEWYYTQLKERKPIGVSTGLFHVVENGRSTKQNYNHLAMLPETEAPAGGKDTFIQFNQAQTLVVNIDAKIKALTDTDEATLVTRVINTLQTKFASVFKVGNNTQSGDTVSEEVLEDNEDQPMFKREDVINMLEKIEVNVSEDMTDDELKALLEEALTAAVEEAVEDVVDGEPEVNEDGEEAIEKAVNKALKPVLAKMAAFEMAANKATVSAKQSVISNILAVNSVYTKTELEAMPQSVLDKMAAQYVPAAGFSMQSNSFNGTVKDEFEGYSMNAAIDQESK